MSTIFSKVLVHAFVGTVAFTVFSLILTIFAI